MIKLRFTPRKDLAQYEWDFKKQNWVRPEFDKNLLKELSERSNVSGLGRLSFFLGLLGLTLCATLYVYKFNFWLAIPCLYAYYFVFGFWGALAHELQHKTVFAKSLDWFSEILFFIAQTLVWLGPAHSRRSHVIHHRYTMVKSQDHETRLHEFVTTRFVRGFLLNLLLNMLVVGAIYNTFKTVWVLFKRVIGMNDFVMRDHCSKEIIRSIRIESFLILVIHASVVFSAVYFKTWLPLVFITLGWPVGGAFENLWHQTQHMGRSYDVNDQRLATRSVKVNPLVKLLYWGLDDHIEHHLYPIVPSRNLPRLHEALKGYVPERRTMFDCWREILAIGKERDKNPDSEYVAISDGKPEFQPDVSLANC